MTIGNKFKRFLALILCLTMLCGVYVPSAAAEDDFLLQLFLLALMEEYGLTDIADLLAYMGADSVEELYGIYGDEYGGYGDDYYSDPDAAYYDDEGYPIYLDGKTDFYYGLYDDGSAYIAGYAENGRQKKLVIPSEVDGYPVYDICPYAFADVSGIGRVTVSEGIERIDENAFAGCDLEALVLPESLISIEYNAFTECAELKEISFAEGLDYIGMNAFAYCTSLQSVILPDSVTEIDYDAFFGCTSLEEVHIGSGLQYMAGNIFSDAEMRDFSVSKDNRVFRIEDGILYNNDENSIVRYPGLIRNDTEFTVPDGITAVEYACFGDKNTIKRLMLPDTVQTIGDYAFYGCDQCEFFGLGSGLTTLGDVAVPTNLLRGIQLPSSLTSLQDLSLYVWEDEPAVYDELWIVAYDGSPAAEWAEEKGYTVYPPSEGVLVAIGAMTEKKAGLTVSPEIALAGETVALDLQVQGYESGPVRFIVEGEDAGTAELIGNAAHLEFMPSAEGVYTVSALIGRETVAYAQMVVSGDGPLTIQQIPERCYHEYAHKPMPDYVETTCLDAGLQGEHMETTVTYEAWVCSRCKAYCIEEGAIKTVTDRAPHKLTLSGCCPCGKRITEGVSPVNEVQITDRTLPNAVWCYTLEECAWYTAPGGAAGGTLAGNTPVQVLGFDSGYVLTTVPGNASVPNVSPAFLTGNVRAELPEKDETAYIPAGYLSLLPLENPKKFGYHKDLTLDKVRLSQLPSEEALYEYYQDVRLWDNYLQDVSAYENGQFDADTLHGELVNELYRTYDETLLALGGADMLVDFEALLKLEILDEFKHIEKTMNRGMPSLDSLKAFANVLGYQDYLKSYTEASKAINKLVEVRNLVSDGRDLYKDLSPEQKKKLEEFFDYIDDLPFIDTIDDFCEDLLKRIGSTKTWEKIKPYAKGGIKITDEVLNMLDMLLPVLDTIIVAATLEDFFARLTPEQKAMLKKLSENEDDPYIAALAEYALDSDIMHEYLLDSIVALAVGKGEEAVIKSTLMGKAYTVYQDIHVLFLGDTINTASAAYDSELERYMAYEVARIGIAGALAEQLRSLPARPDAAQLAAIESLVNEYARLSKIAHPGRNSSFARQALEEISRCRLYEHAPAAMPEKPMLFRYQP